MAALREALEQIEKDIAWGELHNKELSLFNVADVKLLLNAYNKLRPAAEKVVESFKGINNGE